MGGGASGNEGEGAEIVGCTMGGKCIGRDWDGDGDGEGD